MQVLLDRPPSMDLLRLLTTLISLIAVEVPEIMNKAEEISK
jgi:hypothetical protein